MHKIVIIIRLSQVAMLVQRWNNDLKQKSQKDLRFDSIGV